MKSGNSLRTNLSKSILILGNGYVGNKLYQHLDDGGYSVSLFEAKTSGYHDRKTFWRLLLNMEPDLVINCSGFTGRPNIDQAEELKEECWKYNVENPLQIAELCNSFGVKHIHISSGCIYNGYDKEFTEEDKPNFGLFDESSFYSKSKHAFEIMSSKYPSKILRLRMPITGDDNPRCYLSKIRQYPNLIDFVNSKTYIPDLCGFVMALIESDVEWKNQDIYNVVNSAPLSTKVVTELMFMAKKHNPDWKFVDISEIPIVAPRSNCVLDNSKADSIYLLRTEFEILVECLGLDHLHLTEAMLD